MFFMNIVEIVVDIVEIGLAIVSRHEHGSAISCEPCSSMRGDNAANN